MYCEADMLQVSMLVNVCDNEYYHLRAPAKSPGGREEEAIIHFYHVSGSVPGASGAHSRPFSALGTQSSHEGGPLDGFTGCVFLW